MVDTLKPPTTLPTSRSRRWAVPAGIVTLVVMLAAGGLFWFFGGDPPAEVDLAATASAIHFGNATATATSTGIDGAWNVDTSVGSFAIDGDTTATFAGFRVDEVLASIGSTTAVGRTPVVSGSITIDGTTLTSAEIVVDLTSIVSDESRREDAIQRALGTSANPEATFVLTEPRELGDGAAAGDPISAALTGDLTINGVTVDVAFPIEAQLIDGRILVTGTAELDFSDFGITTPTAPVVLSVQDHGIIEVQLWLSR
jgi:polyisoprenoid-binding protein YceI